jgi:FkbM family methyltransferase
MPWRCPPSRLQRRGDNQIRAKVVLQTLRTARGIARSLCIYYGDRPRAAAMDRLYSRFVQPGDLIFDIGAHVGDRVASFRRLGAQVVAAEPQPAAARVLRLLYGRSRGVVIETVAVGRAAGTIGMMINPDNPTVSTVSNEMVTAARDAPGWETQRWSQAIRVPVTTLDLLMARHGVPTFIKIDVEGFEYEVLLGLSRAVNAMSFEFTTIQRGVALACVDRCVALGFKHFNAALGESQALVHSDWVTGGDIAAWIAALPHSANSGDIYVSLA